MTDTDQRVRERIALYMNVTGKTKAAVATEIGITPQGFSMVMRGHRGLGKKKIERLDALLAKLLFASGDNSVAGTKRPDLPRHSSAITSALSKTREGADATRENPPTRDSETATLATARAVLIDVADQLSSILVRVRAELDRTVPRASGTQSKRGRPA